jgi:transposase
VTAVAFRATLDDVTRFARAGQVAAYLGLVPQEHSSGERQRRGAITQAGNTRLRWLLVQAAWGIWRDRHAASVPLRAWAQRLAARRRKTIAVVALARRLASILFALWRDGTTFDPARLGGRPARGSAAVRHQRRAPQALPISKAAETCHVDQLVRRSSDAEEHRIQLSHRRWRL